MVSWFRQRGRDSSVSPLSDDTPTGELPILDARGFPVSETRPSQSSLKYQQAENIELERALADREALIRLCLYVLDRSRSSGVVQRIEHGLADIGVVAVRPDGVRFDPSSHEAGGAVETEDASLEGIIAETEIPGFLDHDRVLRAPIVIVYKKR